MIVISAWLAVSAKGRGSGTQGPDPTDWSDKDAMGGRTRKGPEDQSGASPHTRGEEPRHNHNDVANLKSSFRGKWDRLWLSQTTGLGRWGFTRGTPTGSRIFLTREGRLFLRRNVHSGSSSFPNEALFLLRNGPSRGSVDTWHSRRRGRCGDKKNTCSLCEPRSTTWFVLRADHRKCQGPNDTKTSLGNVHPESAPPGYLDQITGRQIVRNGQKEHATGTRY